MMVYSQKWAEWYNCMSVELSPWSQRVTICSRYVDSYWKLWKIRKPQNKTSHYFLVFTDKQQCSVYNSNYSNIFSSVWGLLIISSNTNRPEYKYHDTCQNKKNGKREEIEEKQSTYSNLSLLAVKSWFYSC